MEEPLGIQTETSWLSAICGACGILLLAVYIIWSPGDPNDPSAVQQEKAVTQTEAALLPVYVDSHNQ